MESDSLSHVCGELDGSRNIPGLLARADSGRGDDYRQVTRSDGTVSLSWPPVSLFGTLREFHAEHDCWFKGVSPKQSLLRPEPRLDVTSILLVI